MTYLCYQEVTPSDRVDNGACLNENILQMADASPVVAG